jgi:ubiquinone biosynthesis protein Coq4
LNAIVRSLDFARSVWGFLDLVRHPDHLDRVFQISDGLVRRQREVLTKMAEHFARDPQGAAALRDKPRLRVDLDRLSRLPAGTLGRVYADELRRRGLDPSSIPTLPAATDAEFVRAHLYETHDVWHAVTGFDTDVAGELGLQAFYGAQAPGSLPMVLLGLGMLNTAFYALDDRERRLDAISRGWQMGREARPLFGADWSNLWAKPLGVVRQMLRIDTPAIARTPEGLGHHKTVPSEEDRRQPVFTAI